MKLQEKIFRAFFATIFFLMNTHVSLAVAASASPFKGYNSENMTLSSGDWSLENASIADGTIKIDSSGGKATFVLDVSSIGSVIDMGHLEIDFSANAFASAEDPSGEIDSASITIGFSASSDSPSSTVDLTRDNSSAGDKTLSSNAAIPSGTRYIFVTASGSSANDPITVSFSSFSLSISAQKPSLSYEVSPAGWTNGSVTVYLTASDPDSGIEGIYNASDVSVASSGAYQFTTAENGSWRFYAKDFEGNVSDVVIAEVVGIDFTAPGLPTLSVDSSDWSKTPVDFTITAAADDAGPSPVALQYRLNGGAWQLYSGAGEVSEEGVSTLEARALDGAGNASDITEAATVRFDSLAPDLSLSSTAHLNPAGSATVNVTVSDSGSGVNTVKYASGSQDIAYFETGAGEVLTGSSFETSGGGTYTVYASDVLGNSSVKQITVNTYPSIDSIKDQTLNEDTSLDVNVNVSDIETLAGNLSVSASSSNKTLMPDPTVTNLDGALTLSLVPAENKNGTTTITVFVTDGDDLTNSTSFLVTVDPVDDAPVGTADDYSTDEDVALSVGPEQGVLANDLDVDNDGLSAILVSSTTNGTLLLNPNGSFEYQPNSNFNGSDSFSYKVSDGISESEPILVNLTITAVDDSPIAGDDEYSVDEDGVLSVTADLGVLLNDSDNDSEGFTAILSEGPNHGNLTLNADGSFTYTPTSDFFGNDSFTYAANDGNSSSETAVVNITVNGLQDAPVAVEDAYSTDEDTILEVSAVDGVLVNDVDVDGDSLAAAVVDLPLHGTLVLNADGSFSYTPADNYNGVDSFTYSAYDGLDYSAPVTVEITLVGQNDAPVAAADMYHVNEDEELTVSAPGVLSNDSDIDGDTLSAELLTSTTHGTLTLNANGSFTYTPAENYNGLDEFQYKISDGSAESEVVTVTLTVDAVNDIPVGAEDSYSTSEDVPLVVSVTTGVLANDNDIDGDELSAEAVVLPAHGTLDLLLDGSFTYIPVLDYNGSDSFTYIPFDGVDYGVAVTVSLTIGAVNDAPVAVEDSYDITEDTAINLVVLFNDSDVEGDALTPVIINGPAHGTASVVEDGSILYTPALDYNGADSFTYAASDGASQSNTVTVSLNVTPVNDAPVSVADSYATDEDTQLDVAAAGVLANDTDVEHDPLTAVLLTDVTSGTLTFNPDGSFSYLPNADFNGSDSFTYKSNDGDLDGNEVTVTLTVNPVNDKPVADGDEYSTNEDTALTTTTVTGVLANDLDVEGDTLTAELVTNVAHGTLTLNSNGSFTYTPASNYNGTDSFTYKPYDGTAYGEAVTVTLNVLPVFDAPVAVNDSVTLNEDTPTTINVLSNDTDVDLTTNPSLETLSIVAVSDPPHGSAVIVGTTQVLYSPDADYNGTDSFTYTVEDNGGLQSTATVNLTIKPVNDYPVFTNLSTSYTTDEDVTLTITFNISDVETTTESLMLQVTSGDTSKVANSDLTLGGLGDSDTTTTLKIKPSANKNGDVVITMRLGDGFLVTTRTFTLHITPVNDPPVANNDSYSFTEDTPITIDMDNLVNNDTDIDGDTLSFISYSAPSLQGTLVAIDETAHTYTFTPNANFDGTTTFTYTMTDGTVNKTATVSLVAIPVNDPPTIVMDEDNASSANEDESLTLGFTIHDWETSASLLSVQASSSNNNLVAPADVSISCNSSGVCSANVTPIADKNGDVTLTISVSDGVYLVPVEVPLTFIAVEDAPTVIDDLYTVHENSSITFAPLLNDFDVDSGDTISFDSYSADAGIGTLTHTAAGVFTYTPPAGFTGSKSFTYTITDGTLTASGTVTLNVSNLNNPPTVTPILHQYILEDETLSGLDFAASDVEGDTLSFTDSSSNPALVLSDSSSIVVTHGTGSAYTVDVHPVANAYGDTTITLHVSDGENTSSVSFVLTVYPVNDAPTAVDDTVVTDEDVAVSFNPLLNDLDIESTVDQLVVVEMSTPAHGTLTLSGKTYTYTPFADYNGSDALTYTMTDGAARDTATITITVTPVNDPPEAYDNWATVGNNVGDSVTVSPMNNDNSGDVGDTISLVSPVVSGPTYGTAVVNTSTGAIVYTRTSASADGRDSFVYQIIDGGGLTDTATVYLDDSWGASIHTESTSLYIYEDDPQTAIPLSISDGKGDGWTLQVLTTPTLGTVSYTANNGNVVYYTPNPDANGSETLAFKVTSLTDSSLTSSASIYIRIYPVNDLPVISSVDDVTIPEDSVTGPISVTISDVDDPVDDLVFNVYSNNQQLVLNRDFSVSRTAGSGMLNFTITPIPNRHGTAQIEMLVSDSIGFTTKTFTLTVTSVNDAPEADDASANVNEDSSVTFSLITPHSDDDGDPLTLTIVTDPEHGTAVVNGDQTVTYTPNPNYSGTDSFVYQLDDGNPGGVDTGTVTINVIEIPDAPVITDLTYLHTTLEDTPVDVTFTVTDQDTPYADLEITITSSNTTLFPSSAIVLSGDEGAKTVTLTPAANLYGEATFTVRVSDGSLYDQQTFKVVVDSVNDLPVANPDYATTAEDTSKLIGVTVNDTDVEDATLTVASLTNPSHGTVTNNRDGTITYKPATNYNGTDSFTYTIVDKNNGSATATVYLTITPVNDAPSAVADYKTIVEDNSVTLTPLSNDSDVEGDPITLLSYTSVSHGTLVKNDDNSFFYTPNPDYYGTDTFTYTISDGLLSSIGTVRITITSVNDAPRLSTTASLPWTLNEDTPTSFPIHIYDPETPADNLVITITSDDQTIIPDTSIVLSGSGSDKTLLLKPSLNKFGTLNIKIVATDGDLTTTETYPVVVNSVNDLPTISNVTDQTTPEDTSTSAISFTVTDIETAAADLVVTATSSNTTLIPDANITIVNKGGSGRTVQVKPANNLIGNSTITLTVTDADGGKVTDTFVVTVTPVNDPPTANDDTATVSEDSSSNTISPLSNDTDVDLAIEGDDLTIVSVAGVDHATVTIASDKKSLNFVPAANWNGSEEFTYTMTDSHGETSTANITVTISQVNDAPVAVDDTGSMNEDATPITINVLSNDTDTDLDSTLNHPVTEALSVHAVTQPANGAVSISADGKSVVYTPNANWYGEDTFTYTVSDSAGATDIGQVVVTVAPVNDPPTISDIANQTFDEDGNSGTIAFTVADVDNDVSLASFTVTAVSGNTTILPTITLGGSGNDRTIKVTSAANKNTFISGPITVTVTATDPGGLSAQDTFTVTVNKVNDAPVAPAQTKTMNEDATLTISPISNSVDVDLTNEGDTIIIDSYSDVDNGTVTIATNKQSMTFKPTANWNGIEYFYYTLKDVAGLTSTAQVKVTVNQVNDAPIAFADALNISEDAATTNITVLANDSDVDFNASLNNPVTETWSVSAVTQPASGGTVAIASGSQSVNFTPTANWNGTTTFTYTVKDKANATSSATVTVTVLPVNDAPTAVNDSFNLNEDDTTKTIYVLSNDTDVDLNATLNHPVSDSLTVTAVTQPGSGTAAVSADGLSVTYTPVANWNGTTSFTYTIMDIYGVTSTATVNLTVAAVNDTPVATGDTATVDEDSHNNTILVLDNDSDIDIDSDLNHPVTDSLYVYSVTQPTVGGTVSISPDKLSVMFTPASNWNGETSFNYTVRDSGSLSDTETVVVTVQQVNDTPVAVDDTANMDEDGSAITINVLTNDSDVDFSPTLNAVVDETWSITSVTAANYGTAAIAEGAQAVTYVPPANWNGEAVFTYYVTDKAGASAHAQVKVTVAGEDDPPTIEDIPNQTINEDSTTGALEFSVSDIDTPFSGLEVIATTSNGVVVPADHITLAATAEPGVYTITINPAANKNTFGTSPVTITVTVREIANTSLKASDTFTVTVLPLNDAPVANDDYADATEDGFVAIHPLVNDSDVDISNEGDAISIYTFSDPAHGSVVLTDAITLTYTPDPDWNGDDSFTYTILDGSSSSATATVYVDVAPANDAPIANDDTATVDEDSGTTTIYALSNDSDVDYDTLLNKLVDESWSIVAVSQPLNGSSAISADGLSVTYTTAANWNGETEFTYTLQDKAGATDTATVQVTVNPVNDAPIASEDDFSVDEDAASTTLDVLANDSDVDFDSTLNHPVTDTWLIAAVTQPTQGSVTIVPGSQAVTYAPPANWNGTTTFTYTVRDQAGVDSTATVNLTVEPINDAPIAADDEASTDEDTPIELFVLENDNDVDLDPLLNEPVTDSWSITSFTAPVSGTVEINPGGQTLTYTPAKDWNGEVQFAYTVTDGSSVSASANVTVTVNPINDAPQVVDDEATFAEDAAIQTLNVLANDSDVDFDAELNHPVTENWQIISVTQPAHGTSAVSADGLSVTYLTQPNWNGDTTFTYTVEDASGERVTGNVNITVTPEPDSPVAGDDTGSVDEDGTVNIAPLANDVDPDLTWVGDTLTVVSVDDFEDCTAEISADGTSIDVSPIANFNGTASLSYTVEDSSGNQSTASIQITVAPINDVPIANKDTATGDEDEDLSISPLDNDFDVDFDTDLNHPVDETWHISEVGTPAHGSVIIDSSAQTITYVPDANWNGDDSFSYTVMDKAGLTSSNTINVTIDPVNDPPLISDVPDQTIDEDTSTGEISFTVSDIDTEVEDLTVSAQSSNGEIVPLSNVVLSGTTGDRTVTVNPAANYNTSGISPVTLTLKVSDGEFSASDTFDLTILPVNDAPVAVDDTFTGKEDTKLTLDLLANDYDTDTSFEGDDLTIQSVAGVTHAVATISADGKSLLFVPASNWYGSTSFEYTITDSHGLTSTAKVNVSLSNQPDDVAWIADPTFYIITPVGGERYKDGQTIHVTWTTAGKKATYTLQFFNGSDWSALAENLTQTSFDHYLNHTSLHTPSAKYRVLANWGTKDFLMDESEFFTIDNFAPMNVNVDLTTTTGIKYLSGVWTNGPVTLKINGGWDLTGTEYQIEIDGNTVDTAPGNFSTLIEGSGVHHVRVTTFDPLMNTAEIAVYEVKIDTEAPLVPEITTQTISGQAKGAKVLFTFKQDPGGSGNDLLTLADGSTLNAATGSTEWDLSQDGTFNLTLNDHAGNSTTFAVSIEKGQGSLTDVVVTPVPAVPATPEPEQNPAKPTNAPSGSSGESALPEGVKVPILVLAGLGLLILLLPPNVKIVYTVKGKDGKPQKKTKWRWVIPPNNKALKVKVEDAANYEVILSRILTRSMRGGSLTIEPKNSQLVQTRADVPDNAKGKFSANY